MAGESGGASDAVAVGPGVDAEPIPDVPVCRAGTSDSSKAETGFTAEAEPDSSGGWAAASGLTMIGIGSDKEAMPGSTAIGSGANAAAACSACRPASVRSLRAGWTVSSRRAFDAIVTSCSTPSAGTRLVAGFEPEILAGAPADVEPCWLMVE